MIREFIQYWMTPASVEARQSGYLYESIAFEARARRLGPQWKSHWQTCHSLVGDFLDRHPQASSMTVFGSGSLFEVPRGRLIQELDHLILVDRVFPLSVRNWVRNHSKTLKVELIEADLAKGLPSDFQTDLYISANLLSQLTLADPAEALKTESRHLQSLRNLQRPVLLWTDTQRFFFDKSTDECIQEESTVQSRLPAVNRQWIWNLAPAPELHSQYHVRLGMQSFAL